MRQVNIAEVHELLDNNFLLPRQNCVRIDQDTGNIIDLATKEVLENLHRMRRAIFKTDDDGMIRIATLEIYYGYQEENLYTGYIIRILFDRKIKRIQSPSNSNGVGAPRKNSDCIPYFINN